jgi:hypothetical protein
VRGNRLKDRHLRPRLVWDDQASGIPREVVIQTEHRELTSWFAVFAAGLVIGALTLAVRWNPAA